MSKYETEHSGLTPTPSGPAARRHATKGQPSKGRTASKRKQAKTRPGHEHDEGAHQFKAETWISTPEGASGRSPRATQAKHPPKSPSRKGKKPTLH